jgi:hypothetical protein
VASPVSPGQTESLSSIAHLHDRQAVGDLHLGDDQSIGQYPAVWQ